MRFVGCALAWRPGEAREKASILSFVIEGTHIIYNGLPVGRYNEPIVQAHVMAMDEVMSKAQAPARSAATR